MLKDCGSPPGSTSCRRDARFPWDQSLNRFNDLYFDRSRKGAAWLG